MLTNTVSKARDTKDGCPPSEAGRQARHGFSLRVSRRTSLADTLTQTAAARTVGRYVPVVMSQRVHADSLQQPWRSKTVWKVSLAVRDWGQEFRSSSLSVSVAVSPMGVWAGDFGLVGA